MKENLGLQSSPKFKNILIIAVIAAAIAGAALALLTDIGVSHCFTRRH